MHLIGKALPLVMALFMSAPLPASETTELPESGAVVRLWPGDAPESKGSADEDVPTLTVIQPDAENANGTSVIVCPGGGYQGLAPYEGKPVAQWLSHHGVTGFVLKYRLSPKYHHPVMMYDVGRAIRTVRFRAVGWKLDPKRIGVLGFSAGGHLASTAMTHFDAGRCDADDPIDRVSSRPNFGVLIYPVITMTDPYTHKGSRANLLGQSPGDELVKLMSSELQVTDQTPPCFLVHSSTDDAVPFQNSLMFAEALAKHHVPVELHVFDHGPHGFGLGGKDPVLRQWPALCIAWLDHHGWLTAGSKTGQLQAQAHHEPASRP